MIFLYLSESRIYTALAVKYAKVTLRISLVCYYICKSVYTVAY